MTGGVFTGAMVSETVTICIAETVFPWLSVTRHTTVFLPGENEAGASFSGVPTPQLSVAEATPILTLQFELTISAGIVNTGNSLSSTVMSCV